MTNSRFLAQYDITGNMENHDINTRGSHPAASLNGQMFACATCPSCCDQVKNFRLQREQWNAESSVLVEELSQATRDKKHLQEQLQFVKEGQLDLQMQLEKGTQEHARGVMHLKTEVRELLELQNQDRQLQQQLENDKRQLLETNERLRQEQQQLLNLNEQLRRECANKDEIIKNLDNRSLHGGQPALANGMQIDEAKLRRLLLEVARCEKLNTELQAELSQTVHISKKRDPVLQAPNRQLKAVSMNVQSNIAKLGVEQCSEPSVQPRSDSEDTRQGAWGGVANSTSKEDGAACPICCKPFSSLPHNVRQEHVEECILKSEQQLHNPTEQSLSQPASSHAASAERVVPERPSLLQADKKPPADAKKTCNVCDITFPEDISAATICSHVEDHNMLKRETGHYGQSCPFCLKVFKADDQLLEQHVVTHLAEGFEFI